VYRLQAVEERHRKRETCILGTMGDTIFAGFGFEANYLVLSGKLFSSIPSAQGEMGVFLIRPIMNLPWVHVSWFSRFDVYGIQINQRI